MGFWVGFEVDGDVGGLRGFERATRFVRVLGVARSPPHDLLFLAALNQLCGQAIGIIVY